MHLSTRNHSWVSFQGFAEAYNDTFSVKKEKGEVCMRIMLFEYV